MVVLDAESSFKRCQNGSEHKVCNWVVPADGRDPFCVSCQLNRTIPDLSDAENILKWGKMEVAKRRTLYTLAALGLRPHSALRGPGGLTFEFMKSTPEKHVSTGHENGVIVINLDEADDALREKMRYSNVPVALRGLGIAFILTGLMAIGFLSFSGIQL